MVLHSIVCAHLNVGHVVGAGQVSEVEFMGACAAVAKSLLPSGYDYCVVDYLWFQDLDGASGALPWAELYLAAPRIVQSKLSELQTHWYSSIFMFTHVIIIL